MADNILEYIDELNHYDTATEEEIDIEYDRILSYAVRKILASDSVGLKAPTSILSSAASKSVLYYYSSSFKKYYASTSKRTRYVILSSNYKDVFLDEINKTTNLKNTLSDFCIKPIYTYDRGEVNGFATSRSAHDTYVNCLKSLTELNTEYTYNIFHNIHVLLFPEIETEEISNSRRPILFTFLDDNKNFPYIFGDSRDSLICTALNGGSYYLSTADFMNITRKLAKGVVRRIHIDHKENVERLKKSFIDDLASLGLSLSDVGDFDVLLCSILDAVMEGADFLTALRTRIENLPQTFIDYFKAVGSNTQKFIAVVQDLVDAHNFSIEKTPAEYMIKEEMSDWLYYISRAHNITDFEFLKYISFGSTLATVIDDSRSTRLKNMLKAIEGDADILYSNYLLFLDAILSDGRFFSGSYLSLHKAAKLKAELESTPLVAQPASEPGE